MTEHVILRSAAAHGRRLSRFPQNLMDDISTDFGRPSSFQLTLITTRMAVAAPKLGVPGPSGVTVTDAEPFSSLPSITGCQGSRMLPPVVLSAVAVVPVATAPRSR